MLGAVAGALCRLAQANRIAGCVVDARFPQKLGPETTVKVRTIAAHLISIGRQDGALMQLKYERAKIGLAMPRFEQTSPDSSYINDR